MPVLIALAPPIAGVRFPITPEGMTTVGRDSACDIAFSKHSLSRHHAQIVFDRGHYYLEDGNSTNGTFVNGHRVHARVRLQDGDVVNLHDLPLAFSLSDAPEDDDDDATAKLPPPTNVNLDDTSSAVPVYAGSLGASILKGRLDSLIAAARHLGSSLDAVEVPQRVLDLMFKMFPQATLVEVHLVDDSDQLCRVAEKLGNQSGSTIVGELLSDPQIIEDVFSSGQGVVHCHSQGDEETVLEVAAVSAICVPIVGATQRGLGVLLVETDDAAHRFSDDDLDLASAVGVLAGQALGFSRTHQILLQHEWTQQQMETAREIQLEMVSFARPKLPGYRFADYYKPAEKVGGDYYFYQPLPDGRVILGIADASGKGLAAALAIARFAGEVRFRIATAPTLKLAMSLLNQFVTRAGSASFITCCVCLLNPHKHELTVANAGHLPPLVSRAEGSKVETLATPDGGLPFGIDRKSICHPVTFPLAVGDRIVLVTDGVTEAMNPASDLYGTNRLKAALSSTRSTLERAVKAIVADVDEFRQGRSANDDMCVVALERRTA